MLFDFRTRWTPFTTSRLRHNYILASSWELDEFGNISDYFPSSGINHTMSESKYMYNSLYNLRRKTRDILDEFTYDLVE